MPRSGRLQHAVSEKIVMHRMFIVALASLVASLFTTFSSPAAAEPVRRRTPISVKGEELGSLVFAQLIFKIQESGDIAGLKDEYVQLFNQALRDAGYSVPATEKSVFKGNELPDTDFILAGAIVGFDCTHLEHTTCGLTVEWELLNRQSEEVVYRFTARSEEKNLKRSQASDGAKSLLLGTLNSLLARPRFVEALKGDVSRPPAVQYEAATLKACRDQAPKMPEETEAALNATVVVKTKQGIGSGAFITPDGYFLTAAHVATEDKVEVTLRNGATLPAEVVRLDSRSDVALLRLQDRSKTTACLNLSESTPPTGQDIYVLGAPAGEELSFSVSRGIVSGMRTIEGGSYLQTDAAINPGNSGGPLLSKDGLVHAIASFKVAGAAMEGLGFGVPSAAALAALALNFGDLASSLTPEVHRKSPSGASSVTDTPEAPWFYVGSGAPGRPPGWVRPVRTWGTVLALTGATTIMITALFYDGTQDSWDTNMAWNTAGWALAGVGVGMFVSSFIFKPKRVPPPDAALLLPPRAEVRGGIGLGSVHLEVKF